MARIPKIILVGLIFLSLFLCFNITAASTDDEEVLKLIAGETKIVSTRSPSRIVIGNPEVADVVEVTNSEITLAGKSPGVTTFVYWDAFGEQSFKIKVVAEDMQEIKRRVDNLLQRLNLPEVYTKAEEDEARVLLLGRVKHPQDRERITVALATLKEKIVDLIEIKEEEAVVEIDVQVLELDKGATDTLGFTWPGSATLTETGSPGLTAAKWSTLFKVLQGVRSSAFSLKLDALIQEGKARVLSRPRLACQSGKEAELLVGGEKPTFTTSTTTTGTASTVEYKEYGIKLKIKPTATEDNRIKLALNVEVSDVGEAVTIGGTTTTGLAYPLTKRTTSTELYLNNGQTMAIGGLIKQKTEETLRKLPWLADIPILGMFFRQRTTTTGKGASSRDDTELFITLTPTIISEGKEAQEGEKRPKIVFAPAFRTSEDITDPIAKYAQIIQKRILENLVYPAYAKEAGFQGTVKLGLHISYTGELLEVKVESSSGYKVLDDNAVSVASSISAYPPFPSSIPKTELRIDVPIIYTLDQN